MFMRCVYLCISVYRYGCVYISLYVHACLCGIYNYLCMHKWYMFLCGVCICVYMWCIYECMCVHMCGICVCLCVCISVCVWVVRYVCVQACEWGACMSVRMSVCMCDMYVVCSVYMCMCCVSV